ncbi:hypothetical protein ACFVH4_10215 [Nocardia ignorata]|uniref:hypothetical protein n=1 Tax=Nocardia ignorata TaxID=145285 RepID=UPI003644B861
MELTRLLISRERAVRMVAEARDQHESEWAAIVRYMSQHRVHRVDGGLRWGVESICAALAERS